VVCGLVPVNIISFNSFSQLISDKIKEIKYDLICLSYFIDLRIGD